MCGTVYVDMHLKYLLGSFVRVKYRIPVSDFYLVLYGLHCGRKSTLIDLPIINQSVNDGSGKVCIGSPIPKGTIYFEYNHSLALYLTNDFFRQLI